MCCILSGSRTKLLCFFFFQAEDGIRDGHVTGVQTCALPILGAKIFGKFFEQPPSVLCRFRGILEITLPAGPAAEPTYFISPRSSGNWRPLGRGPTGRTPHC